MPAPFLLGAYSLATANKCDTDPSATCRLRAVNWQGSAGMHESCRICCCVCLRLSHAAAVPAAMQVATATIIGYINQLVGNDKLSRCINFTLVGGRGPATLHVMAWGRQQVFPIFF